MALLHHRYAAIDGSRDGEMLVGNSPENRRPDGSFCFGLIEPRHFAIAVQYQRKPVSRTMLTEILSDPCRAPQGRNIGMPHQQNPLRQIAHQPGPAVEPPGDVDDAGAKPTTPRLKQPRKFPFPHSAPTCTT